MKRKMGAILAGLLSCGFVFPQNSDNNLSRVYLSVEKAVEYALENNRTLKANDIDLEIKKRAADNAWNILLPTLQLTGTMSRAQESNYKTFEGSVSSAATTKALKGLHLLPEDSEDYEETKNVLTKVLATPAKDLAKAADFEDNENAHWTAVGGISASLNLSMAMIYSIKATKEDYEAGKITWEQSQKDTVVNIKKLFYGLMLAQEKLKIDKASLENKRQRMSQAETNYQNGAIPELSLLQTQVDYLNSKPTVESSEASLRQQMDTFAFLLGMPVGESEIILEGSIEPAYIDADANALLEKYASDSLNLKSLDKNLDIMKIRLQALNMGAWTPALSLNWDTKPAMTYGWDFSRWSDSDKWNKSGSLSFTLAFNVTNLLPWSANRQQAKDLEANIKKLELSRETVLENQKVQVRKSVDTLKQARDQITAMGRNVTLAQKAYDVTYRSYRNGMTELLDLRDAENSLNSAKLGLLNQKYQYISALLDLENTLNTSLTK